MIRAALLCALSAVVGGVVLAGVLLLGLLVWVHAVEAAAPADPASLADLCGRTVRGKVALEGTAGRVQVEGDCTITLAAGAGLRATDTAAAVTRTLTFELGEGATLHLERVFLAADALEVLGSGKRVMLLECSLALGDPPWIEAIEWDIRGGRVFSAVAVVP